MIASPERIDSNSPPLILRRNSKAGRIYICHEKHFQVRDWLSRIVYSWNSQNLFIHRSKKIYFLLSSQFRDEAARIQRSELGDFLQSYFASVNQSLCLSLFLLLSISLNVSRWLSVPLSLYFCFSVILSLYSLLFFFLPSLHPATPSFSPGVAEDFWKWSKQCYSPFLVYLMFTVIFWLALQAFWIRITFLLLQWMRTVLLSL